MLCSSVHISRGNAGKKKKKRTRKRVAALSYKGVALIQSPFIRIPKSEGFASLFASRRSFCASPRRELKSIPNELVANVSLQWTNDVCVFLQNEDAMKQNYSMVKSISTAISLTFCFGSILNVSRMDL
jgi:hypothetical protein